MLNIFKKHYKLEDISFIGNSVQINRSSIKIAVIEDNIFENLEQLRTHNFNITIFSDIENLNTLLDFEVIISDIRGVGKHFGSKLEGAHLIQEIHNKYPNKYLIAYSASTFNPTYNQYFKLCDETKRKSGDVNDWVKSLDSAIKNIKDPLYQWEKTRQILIKNRVAIDVISNLERAYIKSFLKKKSKYLIKEAEESKSISDSPVVKIAIESITSFSASLISNLIK
ncbi:MAG: hypothetical protein POELPBGB_00238 [Bacteroidia bacterium]|nr:hypothetical protein [Bacteroidia bacterium]